ncbi:MAG: hypothetical protein FWD71_11155 [Oscillospiraceae bacterium]|nr:hypothetical protein [Oscillospiraceae bacterium]
MSNLNEDSIFTKLGLTAEQTEILYNMEYLKTMQDSIAEKDSKKYSLKREWLDRWKNEISSAFSKDISADNSSINWMSEPDLVEAVVTEYKSFENKTWVYLAVFEAMLFIPYYPLDFETSTKNGKTAKKPSKTYNSLKFSQDDRWATYFVDTLSKKVGVHNNIVERFRKCFQKSVDRLSGKTKNIIIAAVSVVAVAAITAATAGIAAPFIATALVGAEFAGLSGAALVSASLALLGGGAIAIGGAGMAGGVAVIVGGGALLGFTVSSAAAGGLAALGVFNNKDATISQAARLEVTIREILLNVQKDIQFAQKVLQKFKEQIKKLNENLERMKTDSETKNKEIKIIKENIEILKKSMYETEKFVSSYEIGAEVAENQ